MKLLNLINESKTPMPKAFALGWLTAMAKELVARKVQRRSSLHSELSVIFLDPGPAKQLNLKFRKKAYATDILSFTTDGLGELVLCPQVLRKQAIDNGHSFREEFGYLLIHGVLHLLGYEHEAGGQEEQLMMNLQDEVFDRLCKKFNLGRRGNKKNVNRRRNLRNKEKNI